MRNLAAALLVLMAGSVRAQMLITSCDQTITVPKGQTAILQNDLDCTGLPGTCQSSPGVVCHVAADCPGGDFCNTVPAIQTDDRATVNLNGHTMLGSMATASSRAIAAMTETKVRVLGPGRLTGFETAVAGGYGGSRAFTYVQDVTIDGDRVAILGSTGLSLKNVVVQNTFDGISGNRIRLKNVQVLGSETIAISGSKVTGFNVVVHDTGGAGIWAQQRLTLSNSDITGNGLGSSAATYAPGVDIVSLVLPRLRRTMCGLSSTDISVISAPWGVCAHDQ
jgi:hypothetical protein